MMGRKCPDKVIIHNFETEPSKLLLEIIKYLCTGRELWKYYASKIEMCY